MAVAALQPNETMTSEEHSEWLSLCRKSTMVTAKTLFPETFSLPFSKEHEKIFALLDSEEKKVAIAAPRGFGKSSIFQKAHLAKQVLFRDSIYNIAVSATNTQAVGFTENLKQEITANQHIKLLFGNLESPKQWSKDMWVTSDGVAVFPRGAGQQIRGLNFRDYRPNIILVDDLEKKDEVMNEDNRTKLKKWFFTDLMKSVDRHHGWRVIVIGTILHEASLLQELIDDSNWASVEPNETGNRVISIANPNTMESNWPELYTNEDIKEEMDSYRQSGILDEWYMEMMNMVVPAGERCFPSTTFKYYDEAVEKLHLLPHVETIVLVDPAKTVNPKSAESAIVVVSLDHIAGRIFVRDAVGAKLHPNELIDRSLTLVKEYGASALGVEETSLHEFITMPYKNEIARRSLSVEFVPLAARGKKEERVAGLIPYYRKGLMYHNKSNCSQLEAQLLGFPRSKRWDIMDALAYMVSMFESGGRVMSNPEDYKNEQTGYLEPEPTSVDVGGWKVC
jgi:hypothetical protein